MFGDERASAKEMSLLWCGFRDRVQRIPGQRNLRRTCVCAVTSPNFYKPHHYWVSSQISNLSTIGQSILEILRWGVRACRGTHYPTNDLFKTHRYWVPATHLI